MRVDRPDSRYQIASPGRESQGWLTESRPNPRTYQRLLNLASMIHTDLASRATDALRPRDQIDIQSFMWVVGYYP